MSAVGDIGLCEKVCMGLYGEISKNKLIADRKIADKLYGKSYENFQSPGFPHNFSKNYPQDSNKGCIDASRRQLQSVLKIRV